MHLCFLEVGMRGENLEYYAHLTVSAVGLCLLVWFSLKYALVYLLPFIIAWCVAECVKPLASAVSERFHAPERAVRAVLCVMIAAGLLAAVIGILSYALGEAWALLRELVSSGALSHIQDALASLFPVGADGEELFEYVREALGGALSGLLSSVGTLVSSLAGGLPRVLFFIIITVTAALYFSLDLEGINGFLSDIMPKRLHGWLDRNKKRLRGSLVRYLRAYLFIMLITFVEMLVGFLLIGIDYAVLLAFLVALLDALPFIGVGTVLLPIALYNLAVGQRGVALALILLFVIHTVIRQVAEPRIVGKNLGIHPIVSLVLLYVGYLALGAVGILLVPALSVLINAVLNKDDPPEVTEGSVGK